MNDDLSRQYTLLSALYHVRCGVERILEYEGIEMALGFEEVGKLLSGLKLNRILPEIEELGSPIVSAAYVHLRKGVEEFSQVIDSPEIMKMMPAYEPDITAGQWDAFKKANLYLEDVNKLRETLRRKQERMSGVSLPVGDAQSVERLKVAAVAHSSDNTWTGHPLLRYIAESIREEVVLPLVQEFPELKCLLKGTYFDEAVADD